MAVIGRTSMGTITAGLDIPAKPANQFSNRVRLSFGERFDALIDGTMDFLLRSLCRASRGYLCPPDMTSVMYPDEPEQLSTAESVAIPQLKRSDSPR